MASKEKNTDPENLTQRLARLKTEERNITGQFLNLEKELLHINRTLAQQEKDLKESMREGADPEEFTTLEAMRSKTIARKAELEKEVEELKAKRERIKAEIIEANDNLEPPATDADSKKGTKGKKDAKTKKSLGDLSADDLANKKPGPKNDPIPTDPAPNPIDTNKNSAPDPKKDSKKAPENIVWIDKGYLKRVGKEKERVEEWLANRKERLAKTNITNPEHELIEREIAIATYHSEALDEIRELATNGQQIAYKGNIPRQNLDTRNLEAKSGWRDRAYLRQLKDNIFSIENKISDLIDDYKKAMEPRKSQIQKELAVREYHLQKMIIFLDDALSTKKIPKADQSNDQNQPKDDKDTPTPTPAAKKQTKQPRQNKNPAVQSNTINTPMTSEKDFAEDALNTAGFAKYAAEASDVKGRDIDEVQKSLETQDDPGKLLFETFQKLESFKNDLKDLFREDAEGIVEYDDADFESIQKYMEENRVKSPEKIADVMRQLEQVREDKRLITEKEARIAELLKQREAQIKEYTEGKKKEYETAIKGGTAKDLLNEKNKTTWLDIKRWSKGYWLEGTAKADLEKELAELPNTGAQMAIDAGKTKDIDTEIATIQTEKGAVEERYTEMRAVILQNKNFAQSVHAAANRKAAERINKMLQDQEKGIEAVDEEQSVLERINAMREAGTSFTYLSQKESRDFQKEIDKEAEITANREIDKALAEVDLDEAGQYSKLESSLIKFIKKEQLGSKNGPATKNFVVTTLKTKLSKTKKFNRGQALLLSHLIKKIEAAKI